jgi:hypothetical protein
LVWLAGERAPDFSMRVTQPDGTTPPIGGADDGKPIRMEHLPLWDFRPYQAIGAVLFQRADFKYAAGRFHEDALWLLGPAAREQFEALQACAPRETATALTSSGYYVMRSDWSDRADYVSFDCGGQAAGMRTDGVPNSMHGHADCLSVTVWLEGRRVLVDSGLYAYNCGGAWEAHFRETAAHNTAKVDGRDQATHLGSMAWTHSYLATPEGWNGRDQRAWAIGSHDGYARGPNGVVHRRAVWLRDGSYVVIYDEFVGTGRHELTVTYQFAPGSLAQSEAGGVVFDGTVDLVWAGGETWNATIACGGTGPGDGWIAPSLGIRQAAPRLTLTCTTDRPRTTLLTVLAARAASRPRATLVSANRVRGTLALVSCADSVDCIAAAGVAPDRPIDSDARVAVCRAGSDGSMRCGRIGGSQLAVDAGVLRELIKAQVDPVLVGP